MKKSITFLTLLVTVINLSAQTFSIKPYLRYHQSTSSQNEPDFFSVYIRRIPSSPFDMGYTIISSASQSKDFTLASGLEYGLSIDYTFPNQLGIEIGLGYFSSLSKQFEGVMAITNWDYHSIAVRPMFRYTVVKGKSVFIGKVGPTIHYVSASVSSENAEFRLFSSSEYYELGTCTFDNQLNWGYSVGLEYNYQLSKQWALAMELGIEQYKYTPNKATVKYGNHYLYNTKEKDEIFYVDKIVNEQSRPYATLYSNFPIKRLKETIFFNNIYFEIGIKYNLRKK